MKMKTFAACALAGLVAMSLVAGCGGNKGGDKKGEVVKIGFLTPLTGGNAGLGVGMKNSAELAVKQANESGKYPYKFELVVADDASDPSTAVSAANKLIADKNIIAVAGHFNSTCALATAPVFHKNGCPLVVAAAIHPGITANGYKEITRVMTPSNVQGIVSGKQAASEFNVKTICLINDRTDYGKTNASLFAENAEKQGAKVLSNDGISIGQQDFNAVLTNIKQKNPDCIYFGGMATEAALIRRQMADLKIPALFVANSGIIADTFIKIAGPASEGCIAWNTGKPLADLPGGLKFSEDYKKAKFAEPHENVGPFGYEAVALIIDTVAKTKITKDRMKFADALRKADFTGILGKTTFDKNGDTTNDMIVTYVVENGKWVDLKKANVKVADHKIVKK